MLTATVHIADLMIHYQEKDIEYYQIDSDLLKLFKITSEVQLQKISSGFQRAFENEQSR